MWLWLIKSFAINFAAIFVCFYGLECLGCFWAAGARVARFIEAMLAFCCFVGGCVDVFLLWSFHSWLNNTFFTIFLSTNPLEAREFLSVYGTRLSLWATLGMFVGLSGVFVYSSLHSKCCNLSLLLCRVVSLVVMVACSALLAFKLMPNPSPLSYMADKNMLVRYIDVVTQTLAQNNAYINEYKHISHIIESGTSANIIENFSTLPNVVLILGESTQRNYMSLYGYKIDSTPALRALAKRGNLVVFDDVISPHSHTDLSLQKVLTFSNYENASTPWYMQQNLLDILNSAGYETYWLSNQEAISIYGNAPEIISRRAKHTRFSTLNDSFASGRIYDSVLLRLIDEARKQPSSKNFYIIHLMGTHINYKDRYPSSFAHFNKHSLIQNDLHTYPSNPAQALSQAALEIKAHYLNAIAYNDHIVSEIIDKFAAVDSVVIYLSDHGDEVFDFRDFVGHTESIGSRFMVEIPFMIYMSDTFKRKHKQLAEQITQARHLPFMTDDFIHTLLDLLGIVSVDSLKSRALFHPSYNAKRPRIYNGQDYDKTLRPIK